MSKVLILGAQGGLGQQLVKVFTVDHEVIAWDKGEVDITDRELILKKVSDVKPELVINAAAYNAVDRCEESEEEYDLAKKINIDGPKFLAEACLPIGALLVHYSSNYVFAGDKAAGYFENDEPKPVNRYGKTKLHGEKRILELSGRGLKWYIIRTSKLFGPAGASAMAKPDFFSLMLGQAAEKKIIKVVDSEASCFTYTPDLAKATKELIQAGKNYGIYHLVNSGACTWYESALELFKVANLNVKVISIAADQLIRPAKRPKYAVLLNTKLPQLRDYRQALGEYLRR
ncbi:MAG: dTDP-4-dehydrorhamnose reductase [Patescibacteria group bacterium]|nr:dTDP-4-dehydrorhamnose reductase [Patescibacteria group bacterium]